MHENLQYRRQFLLANSEIAALADWNLLRVDNYYLYSHPDLAVNSASSSTRCIVLIGEIFDPETPELGNAEIAHFLLENARDRAAIVERIKRYVGRYVFLYVDENEAYLQNDPLALREVYYCAVENVVACGSQPNLLAKYGDPAIASTRSEDIIDFYENHLTASKWVGDDTYFCGVKHLLPNHFLDLRNRCVGRYWPNKPIEKIALDEAVLRSCALLQGALMAIAHRFELMMAVTAGTDSRTLLAASRGISSNVYYFINDQDLGPKHPDIAIPTSMFSEIGMQFHIHHVAKDVDSNFREAFINNVFFATDRILPTIYNVYFRALGSKTNILGIGEIGRTRYGRQPDKLSSYRIAYKLGYKRRSNYVSAVSRSLLAELLPVSARHNVNAMTLLYWEQMLGNWGTVGNSESDIAIEEINPYDSHLLYELFLGVDEKYTRYKESPCVFFEELIRTMWPELLRWPINPAYTLRSKVDGFLIRCGVFELLKELKYRAWYCLHVLRIR